MDFQDNWNKNTSETHKVARDSFWGEVKNDKYTLAVFVALIFTSIFFVITIIIIIILFYLNCLYAKRKHSTIFTYFVLQ